MFNKIPRFNRRGLTFLQLLGVMALIAIITGISLGSINFWLSSRDSTVISNNISQLETSGKSYYSVEGVFAVKANPLLNEFPSTSPQGKFLNKVKDTLKVDTQVIVDRFRIPDDKKLISKGYLSESINDIDYYILDTRTGKIYHLKDFLNDKEIEELINKIVADAGDITDLKLVGEITVELNGKRMDKILTTASLDGKLIVGGEGAIKVALVIVNDLGEDISTEVIDLTPKLRATAQSVTELRLVSKTKVVVHYYDGKELVYQTITF